METQSKYKGYAIEFSHNVINLVRKLKINKIVYCLSPITIIMWPILSIMYRVLNRVTVIGKENIPKCGGVLLLSNHQSLHEGHCLALTLFPKIFYYPAKAEYFKNVPLAIGFLLITAFHSFPVRRGEHDETALQFMVNLLKGKENVLIFPEGTRSKDGKIGKGKVGVGRIIYEAKPIVIPTLIKGFNEIKFPFKIWKKPKIIFGKPLDFSKYYEMENCKETSELIVNEVMSAIKGLENPQGENTD